MNPVGKALWFIEGHLMDAMSLADIAEAVGVSRFHLARTFGLTTGQSVMRYVRRRRLTEAARMLSTGAADILPVALEAGYGSHEAFTRAFRGEFGLTPEAVRSHEHVAHLNLTEAMIMDDAIKPALPAPRFVDGPELLLTGLSERHTFDNLAALPGQWQAFRPHIGHIPGEFGTGRYGVCYNTDESGFDYLTGVEVRSFSALPSHYARLSIDARRYAVFTHAGHVAQVRGTFIAIFNDWFPASSFRSADAPVFEHYDTQFDPRTGLGGFEIWVPIVAP